LEANVTRGWLAGFVDVVDYRGSAVDILDHFFNYGRIHDALLLTHWAAASLIIFGFLYALAAGRKRTR
jgi:hypothetical protein